MLGIAWCMRPSNHAPLLPGHVEHISSRPLQSILLLLTVKGNRYPFLKINKQNNLMQINEKPYFKTKNIAVN